MLVSPVRNALPTAKPATGTKAEAPAAAAVVARPFQPKPVQAQATRVSFNLPTLPQAAGGVLAGGVVAVGTFIAGLGLGMGGAGALANLVIAAGWLVATPAAAYFGGKLAGHGWDALTNK